MFKPSINANEDWWRENMSWKELLHRRLENALYEMGASPYYVLPMKVVINRKKWASYHAPIDEYEQGRVYLYVKKSPMIFKVSKHLKKFPSDEVDRILWHEACHYFGHHRDVLFKRKAAIHSNSCASATAPRSNASMRAARSRKFVMEMFE
jgi:hypothetical protein